MAHLLAAVHRLNAKTARRPRILRALRCAIPLLGLALLVPQSAAQESAEHAVVVLLTGGSRPQDLDLMPRLKAEGKTGLLYTSVRTCSGNDAIATRAWLSGRPAGDEAPPKVDLLRPTVFERLRKGRSLPRHEAWLLGAEKGDLEDLASSRARLFGAAHRARSLPLKALQLTGVREWAGRAPGAAPLTPAQLERGEALRRALEPSAPVVPARVMGVLGELPKLLPAGTAAPDDVMVLGAAEHLARRVRPRLLVVLLRETAVARRSVRAYRETLTKLDEPLARFVASLRSKEGLGPKCAVFVAGSHGLNRRPVRETLGTNDGSTSVQRSWLFAWGPEFRSDQVVKASVSSADLVPTLARLLAFPAEGLEGRMLRQLMERR